MVRNKAARRYLRRLRWSLPCKRNEKRKIVFEIKTMLEQYLTEYSGADYNALVLRFGTPEDVVLNYLENLENAELARRLQIKSKNLKIVLAVAGIAILLWAGTLVSIYFSSVDSLNGYYIITVDTIEDVTIGE